MGVGGAAIAMMTLLGTLGTCGLGTLLIARLPLTEQGRRRVLIRTALAVAGGVAGLLALVVPFVAIHVLNVGTLDAVAGNAGAATLFAFGTAIMAVGLVVDQAVLVLGNGTLQTERNAVASATKLGALVLLALAGQTGGVTIFLAWTIGTLVSLPLVAWRTRGGRPLAAPGRLLDLRPLRGLGRQAAVAPRPQHDPAGAAPAAAADRARGRVAGGQRHLHHRPAGHRRRVHAALRHHRRALRRGQG